MGVFSFFKRQPVPTAEAKDFRFLRYTEDVVFSAISRLPFKVAYSREKAERSSVVGAILKWAGDQVTEPELIVERAGVDGWEKVTPAEMPDLHSLLDRPLSVMTMDRLLQAISRFLLLDGEAFVWVREEVVNGKTMRGLQPLSLLQVTPPRQIGAPYKVQTSSGAAEVDASNMAHFRMGLASGDAMVGQSPFACVAREIETDAIIAEYQGAIVRSPVPGMVISFSSEDGANLSREEIDAIVSQAQARFGGENRGMPVVLSGDMKVHTAGYTPSDLSIEGMARLGEQRICAAVQISPIVLGLGAGLDKSTFNNYETALAAAVWNFCIPLWQLISSELGRVLLPRFGAAGHRFRFAYEEVQALSEDKALLAKTTVDLFKANIIDQAEARRRVGESPDGGEGVWYWMMAPQAVQSLDSARAELESQV